MSDLDIFKDYVLCRAEHCFLISRKPKLYGDIKSRYPKITETMKKLLCFWVDISHKWATNSTGIRAKWINCLLDILKVLLNLHSFPLLNINCNEPYLGPLYRSCNCPERVLLNGAWKVFKGFTPVKMCGLSPLASFYFGGRRGDCFHRHDFSVFFFHIWENKNSPLK